MNVDYKNKKSPDFKKLNFLVQSYGLTQHINTTMHNTDKSNSLIDIALSNSKFISLSGTLEHFLSDHQPMYLLHKKIRDKRPKAKFQGRSYRNFNLDEFRTRLAKANWATFYESANAEVAWTSMLDLITSILDHMCPVKTFHFKNYRPDWLSKELIE